MDLYRVFSFISALVVASCDIDPRIRLTSVKHWFTLFVFQVSRIKANPTDTLTRIYLTIIPRARKAEGRVGF